MEVGSAQTPTLALILSSLEIYPVMWCGTQWQHGGWSASPVLTLEVWKGCLLLNCRLVWLVKECKRYSLAIILPSLCTTGATSTRGTALHRYGAAGTCTEYQRERERERDGGGREGGKEILIFTHSQVRVLLPSAAPASVRGSLIEIAGQRIYPWHGSRYWRFFLGNQLCDHWNYETNGYLGRRWYHDNYAVKCRVRETTSGAWNATVKMNIGTSWNHSHAMTLGYDGKLSMFELYPGLLQ